MADIKVRFEVNPNAESELLGYVNNVNAEISNVSVKTNSSSIFQNIPTSQSNGINGLSFAQDLVFDGEGFLDNEDLKGGVLESEQNPTEFVWGVVPESKQYSVKLTFSNASNLKDIIVYGDQVANQFPTRAIIDGTTEIFSDDYRWAINLQTESDTHTIEFTHWNRANYNATLTFISVMMKYFEIDKRNGLKSVESLSQSTGQPKEIFYGVVPSSGSLEVLDVNGEIEEMIRDGVIPNSNLKIEIFANNKQVQKQITTDSEFNIQNKYLDVHLSDEIEKWENIKIFQKKNYSTYLYTILKQNLLLAGYSELEIEEMCSNKILYYNGKIGTVKDYLSLIYVPNAYNDDTNLSKVIEDICVIAQLNVFQDSNGKIKFVNARPRLTGEESIISIPLKNQMSVLEIDFIVKNKYDKIKYLKNVNEETLEKVYNINNNFKDEYGNLDLSAFGNYAKIITEEDKQYLCFISEVSSSSNAFWFGNVYSKYNIHPIQVSLSKYDNTPTSGSRTVGFAYSDLTREEYNFENIEKATILQQYSTLKSETIAFKIPFDAEDSRVNIELYGRCFNTKSNEFVFGSGDNEYKYNYSNTWLNTDTYYVDWDNSINIDMYDIISQNIIDDNLKGIKTAKITVNCGDYYDIKGNKVKDWGSGDIIEIGDIVQINKDNFNNSAVITSDRDVVNFKVTGRTFRNQGVPLLDLELMEISQNPISNVDYIPIYFIISGNRRVQWVRRGETLTLPVTPSREGWNFYGWSLDGKNVTEVKMDNIQESATYTALFYQYNETLANDIVGTMVDNGILMFNNVAKEFEDRGYQIDWNYSTLGYSIAGYFREGTSDEISESTPIFSINQSTIGSSININNLTIYANDKVSFYTKNSCIINISKDYGLEFIDNNFSVVTKILEMELPEQTTYKIVLNSSRLFIISV